MKAIKYDWIKTLLKTATYGVTGIVATTIIQLTGEGVNIKEALLYGVSIGAIAGFKNVIKHYFNVDLDFTRLKK